MKAEIGALYREQRADHQAGAHQQHHGQRHFGHHERASHHTLPRAAETPRPASLSGVSRSRPDRCKRGATPNSRADHHRDGQREQQHRQVQRDLRFVGDGVGRHHGDDSAQSRIGQQYAQQAAAHGQQQALRKQLPHDPEAPRAHRRANRHFAPPVGAARQQQVRHVDARDQQQQAHRSEQDPQGVLNPAGEGLAKGLQPHASIVWESRSG